MIGFARGWVGVPAAAEKDRVDKRRDHAASFIGKASARTAEKINRRLSRFKSGCKEK